MIRRKYFIGIVCLASIVLCLFSIFPIILQPVVQASPDEETRSPTSEDGYWDDAGYAYTSNNTYASAFIRNGWNIWGDYGFSVESGMNIDEVLIGVEHYVSGSIYSIQVAVYDGTDWSAWSDAHTYETETMLWLDFTGYNSWTPERINAIETKVIYRTSGGGGCYPNNMYFVVIENASLLEQELLNITDWNFYNPRQIQEALNQNRTLYVLSWSDEEGWFVNEDSLIVQVDEHDDEDYTLYDVYSGVMDIDYVDEDGKNKTEKWVSHIELTSNHELLYSFDGDYWFLDTSESLYNNWMNNETIYINHLWWNYTLKPFPVTDVKVTKKFKDKVYNVWTKGDMESTPDLPRLFKKGKTLTDQEYDMLMHLKKCGVPIGQFPPFLSITAKVPWTVYLDWIPVKVTWSEGEEEEEEVDCDWIGVNNTIAGQPTLFSSDWTDLNQTDGLSHNRFCTNNTGTMENDTWTDTWYSQNWTETVKTLNSSLVTIAFRWYVNDTSGEEYASTICFFTTVVITNFSPSAFFTYKPFFPFANNTVYFDASESLDTDGGLSSYSWDFGDGENETGETTTHMFTSDGTFTVNLTVTDDDGSTDSYTREVSVFQGFSIDPIEIVEHEKVVLLGQSYLTYSMSIDGFINNYVNINLKLKLENMQTTPLEPTVYYYVKDFDNKIVYTGNRTVTIASLTSKDYSITFSSPLDPNFWRDIQTDQEYTVHVFMQYENSQGEIVKSQEAVRTIKIGTAHVTLRWVIGLSILGAIGVFAIVVCWSYARARGKKE